MAGRCYGAPVTVTPKSQGVTPAPEICVESRQACAAHIRIGSFRGLRPVGRRLRLTIETSPISEGHPTMANPTVVKIAKTNADAVTETGNASMAAVALTDSGNASRAAVQELTKAYQELATKNVQNLTAAMQALAAVKSPAEFIELQQRLIKEGVEAAVRDSQHIAQLTTAVFTAAFEPVKKQIEAVQKTART